MSPEDDQLHPSMRLSNIDIEMPAVGRGWSPIAQSDGLPNITTTTTTNNTPKKPTTNGNGTQSAPAPAATTSSILHPPSANGSVSYTPTTNGQNGTVGYQNGNNQNGSAGKNGQTSTTATVPNGNGSAAYALLNNGGNTTITAPESSPPHHHQHHPNSRSATTDSSAAKTANNNDVWSPTSATTSSPSRIEKNGWKELPQDEQEDHLHNDRTTGSNGASSAQPSSNGSNGAAAAAAAAAAAVSDKLHTAEDDPLTGVVVCKDIDADELSTCGIGACQPKWARMFATTKSFMCVFLIAWVLQGMYLTYVVSVITTIEKLFQIKSKTSGMLLSATEIGQICTALLLTYFAGQGHRPRWIACGMVLFAVCAFGCSIPHFMYGSELLQANNALYSRSVSTAGAQLIAPATDSFRLPSGGVDETMPAVAAFAAAALTNRTPTFGGLAAAAVDGDEYNLCREGGINGTSSFDGVCKQKDFEEQAQTTQITYTVLLMLVVCMVGVGVGQTAVATLGIPFIDDNVASRESAIYIAITIGVRILGPTSGFMLGSVCTRLHVDLHDPGYGPDDPKWVGAWYLGLVIIPTLMFFAIIAMFTFPKHLRGHRIPPPIKLRAIENAKKLEKQEEDARPRLRDFPKTIRRQLSNDILMFRTASSVLHLLPVAGLYTFLPKYLESQFQMAAHESSMITGTYGILVMGVGIVISGVVILKCSPTARSVAAYIAFTAIVYSAGMAALMFLGCSMDDFIGLKTTSPVIVQPLAANYDLQPLGADTRFVPPCNVTCNCDFSTFAPICGADGKTYFSSCHAGCNVGTMVNGKMQYRNCQCIENTTDAKFAAITGHCDSTCQSYMAFIALFSFLVFMHSTSEVGSMLLIMRCTDPKDKAMAMGIIQFAIGLFGNVPCPIIYGAVIDSTCLVWDTICGKQGACKQYDRDAFRHFFFGTTSGIMFLAFIMDLVVWHKAHRIDIDPENNASTSSGSVTCEADTEKPSASAGTTIVPDSSV